MADETPNPSTTAVEPVEPDSTSHGVDALEAAHKKPPKTYEKRKISLSETSQNDVTSSPCSETSPATTSSPQNTSRYGRARKPKITEDFYNTEDIFGPYERIPASPIRSKKKQPLKLELTPNKSNDFVTLDPDTIKPDLSILSINIPEEQFEVSKVMKIVSNNTSDEFSPKSPSFTKPVKTYSGKREKQNSESIYESFGLPDYPSGEHCPYVNGLSHSEDSGSENENAEKSTNTTSSSTASTTSKEIKRTKFNLLSLKKNTKSPVKQLIQSDNISTSTPAIKSDVANKKKILTKHKIKVAKIMKNKFRLQKKAVPISRLKAKKLKPLKKVRAQTQKVNLSEDSEESSQSETNKKIEAIDDLHKMYMPEVGDLTWSRVGTFPFWPSIVTNEPNTDRHTRSIIFGKKLTHFYHVNFFGDNGRRSWVLQTHIFPFHQRSDLEIMAKSVSKDAKPKEPRHLSAYIINPTKLIKWETAVTEAESLSEFPKEKRIKKFFEMVSPKKKSKKRNHASPASSSGKISKTVKSKKKLVKTKKNYDSDFVIKEEIKNEDDDDDDDRRRKIIKKRKSSVVSDDSFTDSEKLENIKEERDTPSPVPSSIRNRRYNLFKGISRDRVCQICGKNNNVYKCKGQCYGLYHIECDRKQRLRLPAPCDEKTDFETLIGENIVGKPIINENNSAISREIASSIVENILTNVFDKVLPLNDTQVCLSISEQIDLKMQEVMKNVVETNYQDSTTDDSSGSDSESKTTSQNSELSGRSSSQIGETFDETELSTQKLSKNTKKVIKHVTADGVLDIIQEEAEPEEDHSNFKCTYCSTGYKPPCFICNKEKTKSGDVKKHKCMTAQCGKYYHAECLKDWPQTKWYLSTKRKEIDNENLSCPYHNCHTCISDDPRGPLSRMGHEKLAKCIRCPTTYHTKNHCIPAGTELLSNYQIICPKHLIANYVEQSEQNVKDKKAVPKKYMHHVNASWCFICSMGGSLICCETCPSSFHVECLKMTPPEGKYICEECESGRLPLYDEIVWVKLGSYRWWPAQILFPIEIPENVRNMAHNKGEFVVRFFGSHDHYWVNRGRVFLFQEGDTGHASTKKTAADRLFVKAIEEATKAHQIFVDERANKMADSKNSMKPPSYIKIKVNKPVGDVRSTDADTSNTTPCDCDPNWDEPCGPDSDCLNRILLTECNPVVCAAGNRCCNQAFQNRDYAQVEPFKTSARGWGLRTLAPIKQGTFVIEYVGEVINETEYMRRMRRKHEQKDENYYFLTIDKDRMIDAGPKGNVARFMNHSCSPNCETQKWTVNGDTKVGLFAIQDIPEGAELTFNYNLECIGEEKKECRCGAPNCSGFIGVKAKQDELSKKKKGKKTNKKKVPVPETKDFEVISCFVCGKTNAIQQCDRDNCNKFYHLECVNLETLQEGKWFCPWHTCNTCTKRTTRCCYMCTNSFCPIHSEGNIRYDRVKGFVCKEHDKPELNAPNLESNSDTSKLKKKKPKSIAEQDLEEILKYDKTSPKNKNKVNKNDKPGDEKKKKKVVHEKCVDNLKQNTDKLQMMKLIRLKNEAKAREAKKAKELDKEKNENIPTSNETELPLKTNGLHPDIILEKVEIKEPLTQNNNLAIKKRKSRLNKAGASDEEEEEDDNVPLSKRFKLDDKVQNSTENEDSPNTPTTPKTSKSPNEIKDLKQEMDKILNKVLEENERKAKEKMDKTPKVVPETKEKLSETTKEKKLTTEKIEQTSKNETKEKLAKTAIEIKLEKPSKEIKEAKETLDKPSKEMKEPKEILDKTTKEAKQTNEKMDRRSKDAKQTNETLKGIEKTKEKLDNTPKSTKPLNEKLDRRSKDAKQTNETLKGIEKTKEKLDDTPKSAKPFNEKLDRRSKDTKQTNETLKGTEKPKEKLDNTPKSAKPSNEKLDKTSKEAKQTDEKLDKTPKEAKQINEKLDKTPKEAKQTNEKMDKTSEKTKQTNEKINKTSEKTKQTNEKLDKTPKEVKQINEKLDKTPKEAKQTNEKLDKTPKEAKKTNEKLDKTPKEKLNKSSPSPDILMKRPRGRPRKSSSKDTSSPENKKRSSIDTENKPKQDETEALNSSLGSESSITQSQSSEYDSEYTDDSIYDSQPLQIDLECDAEEAIARSIIDKETHTVVSILAQKPDQNQNQSQEAKQVKNEVKRMKILSPRPGTRKSLRITDPFDTSASNMSNVSNSELEISVELNTSQEIEQHLGLPKLNSTLLEEKRGPGRPKSAMKKKLVAVRKSNRIISSNSEMTIEIIEPIEIHDETIEDSSFSAPETEGDKSLKRKRGRPRKVFNGPPPPPTPKRPLGRPKKIKLLEDSPKQNTDEKTEQYKIKLNTSTISDTKPKTPSFDGHVNEIKLTTNVPERHLRVMLRKTDIETKVENKFLKMQNDIERDLPIRKRSKLRYEAHL